jgi:hypothetical protein
MTEAFRPDDYQALVIECNDFNQNRYVGRYTLRGVDAEDIGFSETVDFGTSLGEGEPDPRLLRLLALTCSLSYFKAAAPPMIEISFPAADFEQAYLREVLRGGLGEFAYRNNLARALTPDITAPALDGAGRPATSDSGAGRPATSDSGSVDFGAGQDDWGTGRQPLVPVGGGKDSVVTIEALRSHGFNPTLFSVNKFEPIDRCVEVSGLASLRVTRTIDPALITANAGGAYNGHIPVTAINSVLALIVADANGLGPVVMSNERSSNVGNVDWLGMDINHQWSKSIVYESLLRTTLAGYGLNPDRYFSLLRGLSESEIADRFRLSPQYFRAFVSCNRPFALDPARRHATWCGVCPKCEFVFLLLAPRLGRAQTEAIFGRNLFATLDNVDGIDEIVGLTAHKPFECVGEYYEAAESLVAVLDLDEWRGLPAVERWRACRSEIEAVAMTKPAPDVRNFVPPAYREALSADATA